MGRVSMGSNATLVAVASIPPKIWEQDKGIWKSWLTSLNAGYISKQQYKRSIASFYSATNKSIGQFTEEDLQEYTADLREEGLSEHTIKNRMQPVRAYWLYAQSRKQAEV